MKKKLLLVGLLFVIYAQGQQLSFYRESLNFELDSTNFYVSGMYFLRNGDEKPVKTKIFYPYVYDTKLIDTLSVYNCNTMEYLRTFTGKKGHWFNLEVAASDSVLLHIKYNHKHNDTLVTYILLSTQYWKKPFNQADYTLRVMDVIEIEKLFLPVDTTWVESNYTYYQWRRCNYMPATDFTIDF
jgi:hypothetical protein